MQFSVLIVVSALVSLSSANIFAQFLGLGSNKLSAKTNKNVPVWSWRNTSAVSLNSTTKKKWRGTGADRRTRTSEFFRPTGTGGNWLTATNLNSDQCWAAWNYYWTLSKSAKSISQLCPTTFKWTETFASTYESVVSPTSWLQTDTYTDYAPGGTVPIRISTTTHWFSNAWLSAYSTSTFTTLTRAETEYQDLYDCLGRHQTIPFPKDFTPPACSISGTYHPCQSQWETYFSLRTKATTTSPAPTTPPSPPTEPACPWVTLDNDQCSIVVSDRYYDGTSIHGYEDFNAYNTWLGSTFRVDHPGGCTLGCQDCRITGDVVKLLYWPEETATRPVTSMDTATDIVAYIDNTTLTSPTIYLSYQTLYAADSCWPKGPGHGQVLTNTILPLASSDLSSLAYHTLSGFGTGRIVNSWLPEGPTIEITDPRSGRVFSATLNWEYQTVPFDLQDLLEPIAASVYGKLPVCQRASVYASWWNETTVNCPETELPYAPLIAIPSEVYNFQPEWRSCSKVWYGGLFDPPSALSRATVLIPVTTPTEHHITSTPASPRSTGQGIVTQTSIQPHPTPSGRQSVPVPQSTLGSPRSTGLEDATQTEVSPHHVSSGRESLSISQSVQHSLIFGPPNRHSIFVNPSQDPAASVSQYRPPDLSQPPLAAITSFTANGKTFTVIRPAVSTEDASILVGGSIYELKPSSKTVIGGQTFELQASGKGVIAGTSTIPFPTNIRDNGDLISVEVWQASGHKNEIVVDGSTTLTVGGQPVTIHGETVSAVTGGLVMNGTDTINFSGGQTNTIIVSRTLIIAQTSVPTNPPTSPANMQPKATKGDGSSLARLQKEVFTLTIVMTLILVV